MAAENVGDLRPEGEQGGGCQVEDGDYPIKLLDLIYAGERNSQHI